MTHPARYSRRRRTARSSFPRYLAQAGAALLPVWVAPAAAAEGLAAGRVGFVLASVSPAPDTGTRGAVAPRRESPASVAQLLVDKALYWQERGRTDLARGFLEQARELDPRHPVVVRVLDAMTIGANLELSARQATAPLPQPAVDPSRTVMMLQTALRRDPANLELRLEATRAALIAGDSALAAILAREGTRLNPSDERAWLISAEVNRSRQDHRQAISDLRTAQNLRRQTLAETPAVSVAVSETTTGQPVTLSVPSPSSTAAMPAPAPGNPFRQDPGPSAPMVALPAVRRDQTYDPVQAEISEQIAALRSEVAPRITMEVGARARDGDGGLGRLTELTTPITAEFSPGGYGRLGLTATPTFLLAGKMDTSNSSSNQFGTMPLGTTRKPGYQDAQGVGLSAVYRYDWFKGDIGTTPIGFPVQNVVGGIELSPSLRPNTRLRLTAERRPVTDSLLSFAGTRDPGTGQTWGGVTATGGRAQFEFTIGKTDVYAGGGFALLDGRNVASNRRLDFGIGGSRPVWTNGPDELRLGLHFNYASYDKNLNYYTFGQGGYFSPQFFLSGALAATYKEVIEDLTWQVRATLGYHTFRQNSTKVFPNNPGMQARLEDLASASGSGIQTTFPGGQASGANGSLFGEFEYKITPSFSWGGRAGFQHAANYNEAQAAIFGRYVFNSTP